MKQLIKADTIFNTIMLRRTHLKTQVFVLVEGDTDKRLFKKFFNADKCHIEIAFGKENLLKILDKLQSDTLFIAIADADFWHLELRPSPFQNLFITDTHDMETLMMASPAFDAIIAEYAAEDKLRKFIESGITLLNAILEAGKYLGYLRWLNEKEQLSLKFEDLDYAKFIDKEKLVADIEKTITIVKNKSQKHHLNNDKLINDLKALFDERHDLLNVCCGHDLTNILALGFQKAIGTKSSTDMTQEKVESALRLAYHFSYFKLTELFRAIEQWGSANHKDIFIENISENGYIS